MKPNPPQTEGLDHALMAMAGHDLKKIMGAMDGVLDTYVQNVNIKFIHSGEARYIANRVADIRYAGKDMLLCIDEILEALDRASPIVGPLREIMQIVDKNNSVVSRQTLLFAANEEYAGILPDSPPIVWSM